MANFSDFIKNDNINYTTKTHDEKQKANMEDLINKYSKLDNNSLMQEFIKMTIEKKKNGELSSSELQSIESAIKPYLNKDQTSQLEKLLNMVKNV